MPAEARLRVRGGKGARSGTATVPGDKSIGHRAVLFAALCDGRVRVDGLSGGEDNHRTVAVLRALGVALTDVASGVLDVDGVGLGGLKQSARDLDCGNSGTSMRLLSGLLAGQAFDSRLVGDEYLHRRPMRRVIDPLVKMGAHLRGQAGTKSGELYPPLEIAAAKTALRGINHTSEIASAQVKSAILIAGLWAEGPTVVREPEQSRDHTERMLAYLGAPLRLEDEGRTARLEAPSRLRALHARPLTIPGDLSAAAFLLGAAAISDGGSVTVRNVGVNPSRTGILDVLAMIGASVGTAPHAVAVEPVADLTVAGTGLRGAKISGSLTVRAIDELPLIAALAVHAEGTTVISDAAELRVKESDRIASTVAMLRAFGAEVEELPDGMVVEGGGALVPAEIDSHGDHRIAMAAVVCASRIAGETIVRDVANIATSFPGFDALMRQLGVDVAPC